MQGSTTAQDIHELVVHTAAYLHRDADEQGLVIGRIGDEAPHDEDAIEHEEAPAIVREGARIQASCRLRR